MARAKVDCQCEKCGQTFEVIRFFNRSTEARDYEKWAKENCTICPTCYRKEQQEIYAKRADENMRRLIGDGKLPDITGVSEKQIKYAENLRQEWIGRATEKDIEQYFELKKVLATPEAIEYLKKNDMTVDYFVKMNIKIHENVENLYYAMTKTDAKDIIYWITN